MEVRKRHLLVGQNCRVKRGGEIVLGKIIELPEPARRTVVVRVDSVDREFAEEDVDAGYEFRDTKPQWVPEGDWRVLARLRKEMAKLEALPWDQAKEADRRESIAWMAMIIARNSR